MSHIIASWNDPRRRASPRTWKRSSGWNVRRAPFRARAELASRYRDATQNALYTRPALLYIALNMAASALALALIRGYGWTFGPTSGSTRWTQVLVAGAGAMALFRTSLFNVRAGDRD